MNSNYPQRLLDLPKYIYGTTRLGDESVPHSTRQAIAREAMTKCSWFHVSEQYGGAIDVVGEAFRADPQNIPKTIFKIEAESVFDFRALIKRHTDRLGIEKMTIGQLCLRDRKPEDFVPGSDEFEELQAIKSEGLVEAYLMEVFPWTSPVAEAAIDLGCLDHLVEGLIFYFNPLQRFVSNSLWEKTQQQQIPVIAMRSVCGAHVHALRDIPGVAWQPYLQERATQVAPVFDDSDEDEWSRFCLRYVFSHPTVRASVGASASSKNLGALINNSKNVKALEAKTLSALQTLQDNWADNFDAKAEAWSM